MASSFEADDRSPPYSGTFNCVFENIDIYFGHASIAWTQYGFYIKAIDNSRFTRVGFGALLSYNIVAPAAAYGIFYDYAYASSLADPSNVVFDQIETSGTPPVNGGFVGYTGTPTTYVNNAIRNASWFNNPGIAGLSFETMIGSKGMGPFATNIAPGAPAESEADQRLYVGTSNNTYWLITYNDAGTVRYRYMKLNGTAVTWTESTSLPT